MLRKGATANADTGEEIAFQEISSEFETYIEAGFQMATFQGPLCAEPMEGVAYFLESIEFDARQLDDENSERLFVSIKVEQCLTVYLFVGTSKMAQVGGSMITASKEACKLGFLDWSPRLKMAIYSCDIQASSSCFPQVKGRLPSDELPSQLMC